MITTNLFYVIGASGVGKDSLLNYARSGMEAFTRIAFAHRYITRPASKGGENHIALSESEFNHRQQFGCFAMHWQSHGTHYGVGIEIEHWLKSGLHVVVNGSREYLVQASQQYAQLIPVLVTADNQTLRTRLLQRGRESHDDIAARLNRAHAFAESIHHPKLVRIANDNCLPQAGEQFIKMLQGLSEQC